MAAEAEGSRVPGRPAHAPALLLGERESGRAEGRGGGGLDWVL
jgi:hypothetical protein